MELNDVTPYKAFPESGTARYIDLMPQLIADGRTPLAMNEFMERRLHVRNSKNEQVKANWHDNWFFTGDGSLQFPDGSLTVAYDAKLLREVNGKTRLVNGGLDASGVCLTGIEGKTFTQGQLGEMILNRSLTEEEVNNHKLWRAHARDDKKLLEDYAHMVFVDTKQRFNYDTNMGLYLASTPKTPVLRAWVAYRMVIGSLARGYNLDLDVGRLVGKASETQK